MNFQKLPLSKFHGSSNCSSQVLPLAADLRTDMIPLKTHLLAATSSQARVGESFENHCKITLRATTQPTTPKNNLAKFIYSSLREMLGCTEWSLLR
jgi:hypothetical protein